jgi:hypothetical protein
MFALIARQERVVIVVLTLLMAATRIEHFGKLAPDASTAIFFLLGLLIANPLWLLAFLVEAIALDTAATKIVGVDSICVTLGYCMMIPAYFSLWLAPRLLRENFKVDFLNFLKLTFACICGVAGFFLLSNIGYYVGIGFYTTVGFFEYASRVARYFPYYLTVTLLYVTVGVALAVLTFRFGARGSVAAR